MYLQINDIRFLLAEDDKNLYNENLDKMKVTAREYVSAVQVTIVKVKSYV